MMRNNHLFGCALAGMLVMEAPAQAQPARDEAAAELAASTSEPTAAPIIRNNGPVERTGFTPLDAVFQLSADSDKTEVSVGLSTSLGRTRSSRVRGGDQRITTTTRFSLRGTAPLNENGDDTFVNLATPLSGSRVTIGFTQYRSRYTITAERLAAARAVLNEAISNCVRRNVAAWLGDKSPEERQRASEYVTAFSARMQILDAGAPVAGELVLDDLSQQFASLPKSLTDACKVGASETSPPNNEELIAEYSERSRAGDVLRAFTGNAPIWFYGAEGSISHNNHTYLDRTTFAVAEEDRTGYQATAFLGVIGGTGTWSLRGAVSHSRSYRDQDAIEICQAIANTNQTQCRSGADGPPTRRQTTVLSAEGRILLGSGRGLIPNIGIAPEFAYDVESEEFSVDVPIYLVSNNDSALTGGIRVGYSSQDDKVALGVFVGVPFNIMN